MRIGYGDKRVANIHFILKEKEINSTNAIDDDDDGSSKLN